MSVSMIMRKKTQVRQDALTLHWSVSTVKKTAAEYLILNCAKMGAIIRHGPHLKNYKSNINNDNNNFLQSKVVATFLGSQRVKTLTRPKLHLNPTQLLFSTKEF